MRMRKMCIRDRGCSSKPVDIAAELDRGQKYLTEMKYESAIIAFNRVISIDPKNVTANRMLAEAYSQSGKPDEAAAALLTVLSLPEQSEEDRILLAQMIGAVSYTHLDVYKRQPYMWR